MFGPLRGDIGPDFTHGFHRQRIQPHRLSAGAEDFITVSREMTQQAFSHLAARGVAGTEKQNAGLHGYQRVRETLIF